MSVLLSGAASVVAALELLDALCSPPALELELLDAPPPPQPASAMTPKHSSIAATMVANVFFMVVSPSLNPDSL